MPFSSMTNDKIKILKHDGQEINELMASVQSKGIYLMRSDVLVEPNDLIQRLMSNGGTETFKVIDPGYHEGLGGGIPAHYQMKVKKLGLPDAEKAIQSITYNLNGPNTRVNNHSTDNSTNVVNINSDITDTITALRSEINRLELSAQERKDALEVVDAIDIQCQDEQPSKIVVNTLLNALPTAASIASIGSLLVSLLG